MHNLRIPSFLFTNNTEALYGDVVCQIYPFSNNSSSCVFSSLSSTGVIQYGALKMGVARSTESMQNSKRWHTKDLLWEDVQEFSNYWDILKDGPVALFPLHYIRVSRFLILTACGLLMWLSVLLHTLRPSLCVLLFPHWARLG